MRLKEQPIRHRIVVTEKTIELQPGVFRAVENGDRNKLFDLITKWCKVDVQKVKFNFYFSQVSLVLSRVSLEIQWTGRFLKMKSV